MILDVQLIFIIYIVSTSQNSTYLNTIQYHFSVESGEKIGIQITILLADIIYVEILQSTVPIFDTYRNTPYVLTFFVMSITLLCIGLLVTARTLFLYHCPEYEARNFSRTEARVSVAIAKWRACKLNLFFGDWDKTIESFICKLISVFHNNNLRILGYYSSGKYKNDCCLGQKVFQKPRERGGNGGGKRS